ncbi:MAG TPA: hypothetical protein VIY27_11180 [Myxococcota bacterium]
MKDTICSGLRCPDCKSQVRLCATGDPRCLHCVADRCGWCGSVAEADERDPRLVAWLAAHGARLVKSGLMKTDARDNCPERASLFEIGEGDAHLLVVECDDTGGWDVFVPASSRLGCDAALAAADAAIAARLGKPWRTA